MNSYELRKKKLLHSLKILDLSVQLEEIDQKLQNLTLRLEALQKKISGDLESE